MDLFRLAPGAGQDDFTGSPRLLDPRVPDHVFFDGGEFDPTGIPIPRLERGDIPMSTGPSFGDGAQASHWKDDTSINNILLGIMDPVTPGEIKESILEPDRVAFDLIGYDVVGGGEPGDWRGFRMEQNTHDRNVKIVTEQELPSLRAPGSNAVPSSAQFLGALAPNLKAGDDNLSLGFEVHGLLNAPGDVDVYSFAADEGTEVWLDIDRTTPALDSVVELVDANGTVLARSDNSLAESQNPGLVVGIGEPLGGFDHYSTNPRDAGMRVILPGPTGTTNTYQVRVRSSNPNVQSDIAGGLTSGQYQLQIRLQETDEIPGTRIDFADVRFATVGVEISGPPIHSPLAGEDVESEAFNDVLLEEAVLIPDDQGQPTEAAILNSLLPPFIGPQNLGNLLNSDRNAISVFGVLDEDTDVDWYGFYLAFDAMQNIAGVTDQPGTDRTAGVIFDIDYADGLGRPNTVLSVFDQNGTLIYFSDDSSVADDQPGVSAGADIRDLSRGSVGPLDPFIGPVKLATGEVPGKNLSGGYHDQEHVGDTQGLMDPVFPQFPLGFFQQVPIGYGQQGTYFVAVSSTSMLPSDVVNGLVTMAPVVTGLTNRGQVVRGGTGDSTFVLDPKAPANQVLTGEYQLEIRYTPVPDGGFDTINADVADKNRARDQGQIIIADSSFLKSAEWGIVVDDSLRDLPLYQEWTGDGNTQRISPRNPHTQYTNANYAPHGGPARTLAELNKERIVPGITIKNNLIAGGGDGGIHFKGDPNGFVMRTYDLDLIAATDALLNFNWTPEGHWFTIRDINGDQRTFEFDGDDTVAPGNVQVRFDLNRLNDWPIWAPDTFDHAKSIDRPTMASHVASEIIWAIESTSLDVEIYRGELDSFFIEGATFIDGSALR
ncbi:MAG: hypothetical protein ACC645_21710, partial [Pirellulales bacterium]